jgi:hypothetical protein
MEDPKTYPRFGEDIAVEMSEGKVNQIQGRGNTESERPCSKNVTASAYDLLKAMLCCALKR